MNLFKKSKKEDNTELLLNNQMLLKELECVACEKYMKPPILQCFEGHSQCKECSEKNSCVVCRCQVSTIRNVHLENVALKVKYPCKNLTAGCKLMFTYAHLQQHEERCSRGVNKCLLGNGQCDWEGRKPEMLSHFTKNHQKETVMYQDSVFRCANFSEIEFYVRPLSAFGEWFWFFHFKNKGNSYWAVQFLGSDVDCDKYSFNMTIYHSDDEEQKVVFNKNPCFKNEKNWESIRCNVVSSLATMNINNLRKYLSEDDKIKLRIKLRKAKLISVSK